jgi:hypothetical protein
VLLKLWGRQLVTSGNYWGRWATTGDVRATTGDVGATTSQTVIDVDPIRAVPGGAEDQVRNQPQTDLAPGAPETSGAQVPPCSIFILEPKVAAAMD